MNRASRIEKLEKGLRMNSDPYRLDELSTYELEVGVLLLDREMMRRGFVEEAHRSNTRINETEPDLDFGSERFEIASAKVERHLAEVWASQTSRA